ncbi:hypothetical protein BGZ51_006853 [Haplosporangium sp. Z 767]|nr:hypothetical protein BGZ51_006853 [Haplosporangium sp. Z 767]
MFSSGTKKDKGEPPSSASPPSSSLNHKKHTNIPPNNKSQRHSFDSSINPYATSHSNAIPRGNGHQAMSIPMPPPPSLYFSLLPSPTTGPTAGHGSGSYTNLSPPRPSPALHSTFSNSSTPSLHHNSSGFFKRDKAKRSKSTSAKHKNRPSHSEPSTPSMHPTSLHFTPLNQKTSAGPSYSSPTSAPNSRPSSNANVPGVLTGKGYNHYHTHHHAPRSTYAMSTTQSRRSSLSHSTPGNGYGEVPDQRQRLGFFDMAIFDPSPDRERSARSSLEHDGPSHRMSVSRPPSIESINSTNSVPFAPPPPLPPSAWKRFTNHFSKRVIKRHIKFIVALYLSSVLALVPQMAALLGPTPYLANVTVVFMHPSRTIGSQLEVTFFSIVGGILGAIWILPCQAIVAAFNRKYLASGNQAAWAINAAWFFVGVWIMTVYKTRYAKLNCSFIIYTIVGIFAFTLNQQTTEFHFRTFWALMGPMMFGVAICLVVSIVCWPETASEGLGRALNESLDTSRALLNLSTRSFLLNHKTIALPKSVIENAQSEVRVAQKKLHNAYREARYEVTYSMTNPADYKEVRVIVSALMRHLASMSLVVQNERLLMLGHPDRSDEDLLTQSGGEMSQDLTSDNDSGTSSSESDLDSDSEGPSSSSKNNNNNNSDAFNTSAEKIGRHRDYFGDATVEYIAGECSDPRQGRSRQRRHQRPHPVESPISEDGHSTPSKRVQRRGSAAELRRIRQLLHRAENSTQTAIRARQQQQERLKMEALQQPLNFDSAGISTAPPTPNGRSGLSLFGHHQSYRRKGSSNTAEGHRPSSNFIPSAMTTPNSSRPSSIYEEQNLNTVKSFRSLFATKSGSKFKPTGSRPTSIIGFKLGTGKNTADGNLASASESLDIPPGIPLSECHFTTAPLRRERGSEDESPGDRYNHYHTTGGGIRFGTSMTDQQVRKAAEAFRKQREKQIRQEYKRAERELRADRKRLEKERQAEAAARAIPPKEVAFGDRKLFMSFLDIVRDPLQRMSDSCSRVMVAMERELVSGLNVEQDRLERIRRRNAQRADAIRIAEAKLAEEEKAAAAAGASGTDAPVSTANANDTGTDDSKDQGKGKASILDRIRALVSAKSSHLTKEDIDYVEALKCGMAKDKGKNGKGSKNGLTADTIHPNKFLQMDAHRHATTSGLEDDEADFILPPDMSYVQYLTQELEIFDKAEAQGLRDFIATHPTLDVGPREEIFLIFFFLFALREIARELLRLGKYVEELEEQERKKMEAAGRTKRRKQLWWPKVIGNFWNWFAWGSYSQLKTSEGADALIRNTAKNIEHRQPRTVQEEKALVEAKAAKAAMDKIAAEAAAKAEAEKRAEQRKRRHSEKWDMPPLRRSLTLATLIHRRGDIPDLEQGLGDDERRHTRCGVLKGSRGPRSASNSPTRHDARWSGDIPRNRRHWSHEQSQNEHSHRGDEKRAKDAFHPLDKDFGDKEVLQSEFGDGDPGSPSLSAIPRPQSKRAQQYTVVEIPGFDSLQRNDASDSKQFEDASEVMLSPRKNGPKHRDSAPPEIGIGKYFKPKKSDHLTEIKESRNVVLSAPSSTHQDRYPSFASSTSPDLLPGHHESDSTAVDSEKAGSRPRGSVDATDDNDDSESSSENEGPSNRRVRRRYKDRKDKLKSQNIFAAFSRRNSRDDSGSLSQHQQPSPAPEIPKTIFVNVRKPKSFRYRVWESLQPFKSEEFKFGFKMAVALTFIGLWSWLQWNSTALATDRGQWAMLTVMAVLSPTAGATYRVGAMRVAGTLAGTLWALLTYLALPKNPFVICAMMLVVAFVGAFIILESSQPNLGIIMLLSYSSITFIMYDSNTSETIYEVCYKRAITVIVGIVVSVIMNSLLWPILARRELRKEIAILIGRQGVLFAELVSKFLLEDPQQPQCRHAQNCANLSRRDDADEYSSDGMNGVNAPAKVASGGDEFEESFIERAERDAENEKRRSGGESREETDDSDEGRHIARTNTSQHHHEENYNSVDPDRLAFQHVEQQLQTRLIKISELLELSGAEPRLKEKFPVKLYKQIIQCCQNILDRMISMRMAAQLLSPEVRDLVTGPMNYYRRDMVGALLLYFSVLSSSLASKSPLPPYLPSARMARLRVIYNVREAIAAHQAATGKDHYTYIYYYAFTSALEEVIEELELLAILIKPLVGVTIVSSGQGYASGVPCDQLNLGTAMATAQLELPPMLGTVDARSVPAATMVNIGEINSTTAGMGGGAFGQLLPHPQDMLYQQQKLLQQSQQKQEQMQQQIEAQQQQIQQQQLQLQEQQKALRSGHELHPDLVTQAPQRLLINPQIVPVVVPLGNVPDAVGSTSSLSSAESSGSSLNRESVANTAAIPSSSAAGNNGSTGRKVRSKQDSFKNKTGGLRVDVTPPLVSTFHFDMNHPMNGANRLTSTNPIMTPSSMMVMDEKILGGHHGQRFKEALQAAQEASGQQVIEISTPKVAMVPTQIQHPLGLGFNVSMSADGGNNAGGASRKLSSGNIPTAARRGSMLVQNKTNRHHKHQKSQDSTKSMRGGQGDTVTGSTSTPQTQTGASSSGGMAISAAVVTPFGSELIPQAPLPLHMIPMQNQRQHRQDSQKGPSDQE